MKARAAEKQTVYWHRELPPIDAVSIGEFTIEGTSPRVPGTIAHRDELWARCYEEGMEMIRARLEDEIRRRGGDCAHVVSESVDSKHDPVKGEA